MKITCKHSWDSGREVYSRDYIDDDGKLKLVLVVTTIYCCLKCGKEIGKSEIVESEE
jgi:hypothetical protein